MRGRAVDRTSPTAVEAPGTAAEPAATSVATTSSAPAAAPVPVRATAAATRTTTSAESLTATVPERARSLVEWLSLAVLVLGGALAVGYWLATVSRPVTTSRMMPWLAGRTLGLGAYATLTVLVCLGIWLRHPWRSRWNVPSPESALRAHAALGATAAVLVVGHLTTLALDAYAHVGWVGALVPGRSEFRTTPVALGVVAFYLMLLVAGTAGLAGRITKGRWLTVHHLALPLFTMVWFHGVLSGTDTPTLRLAYVVTGLAVGAMAVTRYLTGGQR
jgi:methionine sulfoxide reductase heme-binding subunit